MLCRNVEIFKYKKRKHSRDHKLCQGQTVIRIGIKIRIQISGLIRIQMSAGSVTKCYGFIPLSQGHCGACRRKWQLTDTDLCPCGETQTMSHIVESCPLTKLNGGLSPLSA